MKTVILSTFLFFAFLASGQYYYSTVTGSSPKNINKERVNPYQNTDPDWIPIMSTTVNPSWSALQTIPFTFEFNGIAVNNYKVSSTGVLTFNTNAIAVPGGNPSALPSSSIPDNSICTWGMRPTHSNSVIVVKTFGLPGSRQLWVTFSFCSNGSIDYSTWSIVLEEGSNNIYIVDQWNQDQGSPALTVGVQINSTTAISDPLSPSVITTAGYDFTSSDDLYYRFAPGIQPTAEVELIDFNLPQYLTPGNTSIQGTVHNIGTEPITSLTVTWNNGNGSVIENLSVNIAPNTTHTFTCSNQWNATASIESILNLSVTTSGDLNLTNNNYQKSVSVLSVVPAKYVVGEEITGSWCGWCPRGSVGMANLDQEPNFIGIAVHGSDPMSVSAYDEKVKFYIENAYPGIGFDRANEDAFTSNLLTEYNIRKAHITPCEVKNLIASFNSGDNEIIVSGDTEWYGNIHGEYRLSCVLVEDDVMGTTQAWFQSNAYTNAGNGSIAFPAGVNNGFDFSTAPSPVNPASFGGYDHVARYLSSDEVLGDPNSLPSGTIPMGIYSYTFDPIYAGLINDINKVHAVMMIVDKYTGEVINAQKTNILGSANIDEMAKNIELNIFPNPAQDYFTVLVDLKDVTSDVSIILRDACGNEVTAVISSQEKGNITISTEGLANGIYFVQVFADGYENKTRKIAIQR